MAGGGTGGYYTEEVVGCTVAAAGWVSRCCTSPLAAASFLAAGTGAVGAAGMVAHLIIQLTKR